MRRRVVVGAVGGYETGLIEGRQVVAVYMVLAKFIKEVVTVRRHRFRASVY